jgi:hypothetical protein
VARFDVALTVCAMRYVSDLRIGRVHPRHFAFGLSVEQKKYDLARFLRDRIVGVSNLKETLDAIEPPLVATAGPSRRSRGTSICRPPTTERNFLRSQRALPRAHHGPEYRA